MKEAKPELGLLFGERKRLAVTLVFWTQRAVATKAALVISCCRLAVDTTASAEWLGGCWKPRHIICQGLVSIFTECLSAGSGRNVIVVIQEPARPVCSSTCITSRWTSESKHLFQVSLNI